MACFLSKAQNPGLASESRASYHFPYSCLAVRMSELCILTTRGARQTNINNVVEVVFLPLMQKMILGRNEGGKERRDRVAPKGNSGEVLRMHIQHSETQCGARSPSSPPSFPPFPEAVLHSGGGGDGGSLPFPSPLGLPPLRRTHVLSLARSLVRPLSPLSMTARGRSLVRLLLAPIRTMNDSFVLAPNVPNRR